MIVQLIDVYLAKHPDSKRPKEELDELDAANKFKQDRVILNKSPAARDSSSSSSEEDLAAPVRGRGRVARAGRGVAAARAQVAQAGQVQVQNVCRQCTKVVDGFRCVLGQAHLQCYFCKLFMPDRVLNQRCAGCDRGFCNLYWKAGKCRVGINTVDSYRNTVFTAIRNSCLFENIFEQNVVNNYIRNKGITIGVVAQEMMDSMEINKWEVELGKG